VEALAKYWNKPWVAKDEAAVAAELETLGIEAVLVAFDIESITGTPPCSNAYVADLRDPRDDLGPRRADDRLMERRARLTPLRRCVTADDVAEVMVALSFVNGEIVVVDGGFAATT
jgi:NAD(P)-dependent dehydrogenase (short-subunit alcohol dehydrogenase family)